MCLAVIARQSDEESYFLSLFYKIIAEKSNEVVNFGKHNSYEKC